MAKKTTAAAAQKEGAAATTPTETGKQAQEQPKTQTENPNTEDEEASQAGSAEAAAAGSGAGDEQPEMTLEEKAYTSAYNEYKQEFGSYPPQDLTTEQILGELAQKQNAQTDEQIRQTKQSVFALESSELQKALKTSGINTDKPSKQLRDFVVARKNALDKDSSDFEFLTEYYDGVITGLDNEAKGLKDQKNKEASQQAAEDANYIWITDGKSPKRKISRITWEMLKKQDTGFKEVAAEPAEVKKKGGRK